MVFGRAETALQLTGSTTGEGAASALEEKVTALFDQWREPVLRYILTFGLTMQDGEEIVQEVFLLLFQHLREGRPQDNLRGWVFRVGHNLALKHRYRMRTCENELPETTDAGPNPEEAFAIEERRARLVAVVNALPEQDRCCLHLRAEGLRYREISGVLGMSLGAVALSLSRSLDRLRRADR